MVKKLDDQSFMQMNRAHCSNSDHLNSIRYWYFEETAFFIMQAYIMKYYINLVFFILYRNQIFLSFLMINCSTSTIGQHGCKNRLGEMPKESASQDMNRVSTGTAGVRTIAYKYGQNRQVQASRVNALLAGLKVIIYIKIATNHSKKMRKVFGQFCEYNLLASQFLYLGGFSQILLLLASLQL